jgi:outer membrane protein assembly factor BamB
MALEPSPTPLMSPSKPRRFPGTIVWVIVGLSLGVLTYVRLADPIGDVAVVNVVTLIMAFIAAMSLLVWFVAISTYPRWLRIGAVVAVIIPITLFFVCNKIERVSGSLIPEFRSRFSVPRDATIETPAVEPDKADNLVDLTTTTPDDFPQFLGPDRNLVLPNVQLERDWTKHPPRLVWKQPIGAGWSTFAVVNGFAVTLEQRGSEELVTCYEVATGKLRWKHTEHGRHETVLGGVGPRSTPTIHQGNVYVTTVYGKLLCLEGATGKPRWSVDLIKQFGTDLTTDTSEIAWGRSGSPLIVDDLVVVPAGGRPDSAVSLAAFRQADGELVWKAGSSQISYASPVLATLLGVRQILSVNEGDVTSHDPTTGKVLWKAPWPGDSSGSATVSQPHPLGDDHVLLSKGYSVGVRILRLARNDNVWNADIAWESQRFLRTKYTNVAIKDGFAYGLNDGLLECVDLKHEKPAWRGKRFGHGQVLLVGDSLLVMTENTGEVILVDASPEKYRELGRFTALTGQTWNNLCLSGKYLLVRNSEEAACYKLALRDAGAASAP